VVLGGLADLLESGVGELAWQAVPHQVAARRVLEVDRMGEPVEERGAEQDPAKPARRIVSIVLPGPGYSRKTPFRL